METNHSTIEAEEAAPKKKSYRFIIILALLVTVGGTWGYTKYNHGLHHEETDDAQVDANISPVIPRISGYVTEIRVKDNQSVKKGDTLIVLDKRDQLIKLEQARAALSSSQGNLGFANATTTASQASGITYEANISVVEAQIEAAKVNVWRATQDFARYENLIKDHSITQQEFEQASAAKQTAERQLEVLVAQRNAAERQAKAAGQQTRATSVQSRVANANIKAHQADIANAELNLSYTVITAPTDGRVSKVNAQVGQYLQAGQSLFSIISTTEPWVVANFKETQLTRMKLGQHVLVHVDAYPDHEFEAKVASFSPATGARFALLPPDNASGNFVKVVQRLPVRIEFTNANDARIAQLRPGMNVFVDVELD
ncbi:HlyD family secretion protein [Dyadobacter sediminis]|uniref:HlyD family secretion protein n=1 Tax=Dyadobacter sediminis TaxID=1493691 RepID=A0A5R9KKY5_9BACT|nr:HlyD family secretion protein [Dyadobacter sediminis]TLU96854.1 HlyD family secretion protein [Dyadobacter sediminis]GGB85674.1 secretion protein HlyD [Dyadobacter sediminis]